MPSKNGKKLNRTLLLGVDNLVRLRAMAPESVDLIYLDPPFKKERKFHSMGDRKMKGFDDIWGVGAIKISQYAHIKKENPAVGEFIDAMHTIGGNTWLAYLSFMAARLLEMHRVLKPTGSIYFHCDQTMSHSIKLLMDVIFDVNNFCGEIVWRRGWISGYKTTKKRGFVKNHDTILYYVKDANSDYTFNKKYIPYPLDYKRRGKPPTGKGFCIDDAWNCSVRDKLDSDTFKSFSTKKRGYPTEKPVNLLERIIEASSNPGDLVLDPFCGCASACVAAEMHGRLWLGMDINKSVEVALKTGLKAHNLNIKFEVESLTRWNNQRGRGSSTTKIKQHHIAAQSVGGCSQKVYCNGCGGTFSENELTVDHINPRTHGGLKTPENTQLLCGKCNQLKDNKDMAYLFLRHAERATEQGTNLDEHTPTIPGIMDENCARLIAIIANKIRKKKKINPKNSSNLAQKKRPKARRENSLL